MTNAPLPRMWAIRAGHGGQAHDLFVSKQIIGLRDASLGDLRRLGTTREAFYTVYKLLHPRDTKTAVTGIGGKYFRFMHEMQTGDVVIYPSTVTDTVYVGEVTSGYRFSKDAMLQHQRRVKWVAELPKAQISLVARRELGAARTFFEVKRNTGEIRRKAHLGEA